ncbi:MAG: HAMP domain-containing sensor histidine kinase, partial [Syntrophomonadaceae bacterium]
MATRWKNFNCALTTKIIAFIIAVVFFSGALTLFINVMIKNDINFDIASEKDYYLSPGIINDSTRIMQDIVDVTTRYRNEEHILSGASLSESELTMRENQLFDKFKNESRRYNPNLTRAENYNVFREDYAGQVAALKEQMIKEDLSYYRTILQRLGANQGVYYYARSGEFIFTNLADQSGGYSYLQSLPAYIIFDGGNQTVFPALIKENPRYKQLQIPGLVENLGVQDVASVGFSQEYLAPRIAQWEEDKALAANSLNQITALLAGLAAAFIYLLWAIGRKPEDGEIHLNTIDSIYTDINLLLCFILIGIWFGIMAVLGLSGPDQLVFLVSLVISVPGLLLVLSLVKHLKNRSFIRHSLVFALFRQLFGFISDVYNSGSTAVKVVLLAVGYPVLVGLTFFMFPITLGAAAWLAFKKVKELNTIKEGVRRVKAGDIHHTIEVPGNGEFARLAADINSITDGLNKAVANEVKSERLKSELISNVSHDIRTPLTSIITYVDLLKRETDQAKAAEYIEIIDQKSQRLKTLTDDLFEATKASSGNIPVNYEKVDIVALVNQGLGEYDDKIQERRLEFKFSHPDEKTYVRADGRLLWRAIENLMLNVFKYALEGSRVYIDIVDDGPRTTLTIKNISAYELNISADELMERFKRGDES